MKKTLSQKAYKEIKDRIIFFEVKPGEKLFESEIANELKISRTPVREALLMLEHERLLKANGKRGYSVRRLTQKDVEEYFSIRNDIELFAVPLIIERITLSEMKNLAGNLKKAESSLERKNFYNIIRYETEFHEILYKSTKSEVFIQLISGLVDQFQWLRAVALNVRAGASESINDHKKMFMAIEKKDVRELKRLTTLHLKHAAKKYEQMQGIFL